MIENMIYQPCITAGIVLLLAIVWRLWGNLSKRRHRNKIEPKAPWDGRHHLERVKHYVHYGDSPQEYSTGYIWKCTCGMGNAHNFWRLPYTEHEALKQFNEHRKLHLDSEGTQPIGS
jgi:hypothetical protein